MATTFNPDSTDTQGATDDEQAEAYVDALLREREGYASNESKAHRVKAIDAELKRVGHKPAKRERATAESGEEQATEA